MVDSFFERGAQLVEDKLVATLDNLEQGRYVLQLVACTFIMHFFTLSNLVFITLYSKFN